LEEKEYFKYWGKAFKEDGSYHLLPYHCLDVVAVADIWLLHSRVILNQSAAQLGVQESEAKAVLLFFIALHDLGKFDARFQAFIPNLRSSLQGDEYEVEPEPYQHGSMGYLHFKKEFFDSDAMKAVAGHHGFCDAGIRYFEPDADEELIEQDRAARKQWIEFCLDWFCLEEIPKVVELPLLAGLCSVADWVGSSITNFTTDAEINFQDYYADALKRAKVALNETGMIADIQGSGFHYLFPDYTPQGIQTLLAQLPIKAGLSIVESDTGSGKTEFSLAYASILITAGLADGVVFGLPTQATANGLFDRIGQAAEKLFPDSRVTLAHGKSKYISSDENGFLYKSNKRAFLGSMSVATIDQILMGVLPIRHQFVRSFGTRKSVLILDEIHSFDAYMMGLIQQVLKGQHQAFSSVILLSATLPKILKKKLLDTYGGEDSSDAYPLISHVNLHGKTSSFHLSSEGYKKIVCSSTWRSENMLPDKKQCRQLLNWAEAGATLVVICNTVADAQLLYSQLSAETNMEIDLFHARYTLADRLQREKYVLNKYGKNAPRKGGLLIATQVVEQSLDLDFDLIVSQIAPIEFLMQRMGRLWRHERSSEKSGLAKRSKVIESATFITLCPNELTDEFDYSSHYQGSGYVYKNIRVLYRTQQYLLTHEQLVFPNCYREAINYIHADNAYETEAENLAELAEKYNQEQEGSFYNAIYVSNDQSRPLTDVDPRAALLTREGEMSQTVVLFNEDGSLYNGGDFNEQEDRERSSVSLSKKLAKGQKDEDFYCLKATVNKDVFYNELGVYIPELSEK